KSGLTNTSNLVTVHNLNINANGGFGINNTAQDGMVTGIGVTIVGADTPYNNLYGGQIQLQNATPVIPTQLNFTFPITDPPPFQPQITGSLSSMTQGGTTLIQNTTYTTTLWDTIDPDWEGFQIRSTFAGAQRAPQANATQMRISFLFYSTTTAAALQDVYVWFNTGGAQPYYFAPSSTPVHALFSGANSIS